MRRRSRGGFTLIEVVVSVAVLGVMMTIAFGTITQLMRSKQALEARQEEDRITNALLVRMIRELQLAVAGHALMPPPGSNVPRYSSRINLTGESERLSNGEAGDSITFLAREGGQYLPDGGSHTGIVQITYRVARDPSREEQERDGTYSLVREETPLIRPTTKAYQKTMRFPICQNLVGLEFRYLDKETGEWSTTWGTDRHSGIPGVIRFTLKLKVGNQAVRTLSTAVPLRAL